MLKGLQELKANRRKRGRRKLRLFACACGRRVWHLMGDLARRAVEVSEQYADGLVEFELMEAVYKGPLAMRQPVPVDKPWATSARLAGWHTALANPLEAASLTRAVEEWAAAWYAEPHSTLGVQERAAARERQAQVDLIRDIFGNPFRPPFAPLLPDIVVSLAHAAYDERELPSGHLDPIRLAVLGDALEDAGTAAELVEHLRGPGPHVRGCHVLDMILRKE
jgi:hypothetical protein